MKKLKTTFESIGFRNVVTCINSGNIIFEDPEESQDIVATKAEAAKKRVIQPGV